MFVRTTAFAALAIAVAGPAAAALPPGVAAMIDAAAGDDAALKTVADIAKKTNPDAVAEIDARVAGLQAKAAQAKADKLASQGFFEGWKGSGEVGFNDSSGNSDSTGVAVGATLSKETRKWKHSVHALVDYQRDNGVTSKDRYFAGYEGNYKFSERLYALGVLSWEKDRFAGYTSRFTEGLGIGYKIIDRPTFKAAVEAGPALRQTDYIIGPNDSSLAARIAGNLAWTITPNIVLTENASAYLESQNTTLESTTALTAKLTGRLSARASFRVINESDPPLGLKQTDTTTRFTLVYAF